MYDARGPKTPFEANNLAFGGVVIAAVAGSFFVVSALSGGGDAGSAPPAPLGEGLLTRTFPEPEARRYLMALQSIDAKAYRNLETRIANVGGGPRSRQIRTLFEHSSEVLQRHAATLAGVDARHIDGLLDITRNSLRAANGSGSEWCLGASYEALAADLSPSDIDQAEDLIYGMDGMYTFGAAFSAQLLEAAADAKANPRTRGPMTAADEAAIQGVFVSLIQEPEIMQLMVGAQSGDPAAAVRDINVCDVALTAVSAIKTLPSGAKERLWATALSGSADGLSGLGDLGGLGGF